jgi:hypothetical protein
MTKDKSQIANESRSSMMGVDESRSSMMGVDECQIIKLKLTNTTHESRIRSNNL